MSDSESAGKGWWQTLPGILTATAAIITAITGFVVAIGGLGLFHRSPAPPISSPGTSSSSQSSPRSGSSPGSPATAQNAVADARTRVLPLPAMTQVRSGESVYKILSLQSAPYSPDKVSLRFTVRMTNNGSYPSNFWSSSFRLRVDDSLQAPVNFLDELVQSNSSKEGTVEFVIPADASIVGLQIGDAGMDKPDIRINLSSSAGSSPKSE